MLAIAMVGTLLINFSTEIYSFISYFAFGILGVGMSGLLTSSLFLVNEYASAEHRAYITGLQTFIGVIGITLETIVGALLYEYVSRNGPFDFFAIMCAVAMILTFILYWKYGNAEEDKKPSLLV